MTAGGAGLRVVRLVGCLAVAGVAAAAAGFFGRTLVRMAASGRTDAPGPAGRAGPAGARPAPPDEWRRSAAAPEAAAPAQPFDLRSGAPAKTPADLAVPDGAVPENFSETGMTALVCPLPAAEADRWVRGRMAELGWSAAPEPPAAPGEFRAAYRRPDARCWSRIEPRAGGGCRLFYMRLELGDGTN